MYANNTMPFSLHDSLLVNDADTYFKSLTDTASRIELLSKICASFHPIRIEKEDETLCASFYPDPVRIDEEDDPVARTRDLLGNNWQEHIKENVSLILEECRHAFANALHRRWDQSRYQ